MSRSSSSSPLQKGLLNDSHTLDRHFSLGHDGDAESDADEPDELRRLMPSSGMERGLSDAVSGADSESSEAEDTSVQSRMSRRPVRAAPRSRKYYHSDGAVSEGEHGYRSKLLQRLPMIPSRSRYPAPSSRKPTNKFPKNIPRRVKGRFRKIVAGDTVEEQRLRRIAVYCPSNELDLDALYAHMLQVRQKYGVKLSELPIADEAFSIENNRTMLPTILVETHSHGLLALEGSSGRQSLNRDTVDNPTWTASIFFDVLHLRQRRLSRKGPPKARKRAGTEKAGYGTLGYSSKQSDDEHDLDEGDDGELHELVDGEDIDENVREVFLFGFGGIVFWNWEGPDTEERFVKSIRTFSSGFFNPEAVESAADDLEFFTGTNSSVKHDTVELATSDPIERLAHSFAIAQSSLLSVYESRLDQIIERNEHIPVTLGEQGKIKMSQFEINREIGLLFMERNMINLESDILTTPDIFWENDVWEPVYRRMCRYMEHDGRHDTLNKRLDCVRELLDVLSSQVENQHASKLEWIIIWLIVCEVSVQVLWGVIIKDILGFFNHCGDD
mmetsp:Transcript_4008/g.7705  ORF Transcript_4008/g.7705 Transcript_4008/m.7705 type:complete len:555 (-) Transcript_4008:144-1808(-)